VKLFLKDKYPSGQYAPEVNAPTLIVAADRDGIVPKASTALLQSRFKAGLLTVRELHDTSHNSISYHPDYLPLLAGTLPK
jgi:uncharacterized protein